MKRILKVNEQSDSVNLSLLLGRIVIAALMLTHGLPKINLLLSGAEIQFPGLFGMSPAFSLALAVFAEVFCSILLIIGIGTRLAVIPLIITMFVAAFYVHANDPFAKQEMGILFLLVYVMLFLAGSGKYSMDYLLQRKGLLAAH